MEEPVFEHNFSMSLRVPADKLGELRENIWLWDSGASSHICADREAFSCLKRIERTEVMTGNESLYARYRGDVPLCLKIDGVKSFVCLRNVLYIPDLTGSRHLFSINVLTSLGLKVIFDDTRIVAIKKNGVPVATGLKIVGTNSWLLDQWAGERLELVKTNVPVGCVSSSVSKIPAQVCMFSLKGKVDRQPLDMWHLRLGHLNKAAILRLQNMSTGIEVGDPKQRHKNGCVNCLRGVFPKMISRIPMSKATKPGERVHMDLSGRVPEISKVGGFLYFAVIVDEFTRYTSIYPLVKKSDFASAFWAFKARFETLHAGLRVVTAHADNGTEFIDKQFQLYLQQQGVILETTQYYSPDMNGIAERAIGVITAHASAMLAAAELPVCFWPQACLCAVFLKNRSPTKAIANKTPFELWVGSPPTLGFL